MHDHLCHYFISLSSLASRFLFPKLGITFFKLDNSQNHLPKETIWQYTKPLFAHPSPKSKVISFFLYSLILRFYVPMKYCVKSNFLGSEGAGLFGYSIEKYFTLQLLKHEHSDFFSVLKHELIFCILFHNFCINLLLILYL